MVRMVSFGSILVGLAFAIVFGYFIVRGITRSLRHAVEMSDAMTRGDLTRTIHAAGRDEVAQLLQAMSAMKDNLARLVAGVRANSEHVASASAQIAQGNNDLSSRTEEQASALEQTAASMKQLAGTVQQNAENAEQGNRLAMEASSVAARGGEVVGQVVETMKGIQESSRKIA